MTVRRDCGVGEEAQDERRDTVGFEESDQALRVRNCGFHVVSMGWRCLDKYPSREERQNLARQEDVLCEHRIFSAVVYNGSSEQLTRRSNASVTFCSKSRSLSFTCPHASFSTSIFSGFSASKNTIA